MPKQLISVKQPISVTVEKHKHLFKKKSSKVATVSEKRALEDIFGKNIALDKVKWGKVRQLETRYLCKCGEERIFIDLPNGEYSKALAEEYYE